MSTTTQNSPLTPTDSVKTLYCSVCGKHQDEVNQLIKQDAWVVCDQCVGSIGGESSSEANDAADAYDSHFETPLPYGAIRAGLDMAQGKTTFIPLALASDAAQFRNIALARQHELGLDLDSGLSPTPHGTTSGNSMSTSTDKKEYEMNPNVHPVHGRIAGGMNQVVLEANYMDAYHVGGTINGKQVKFLVDTGASDVSIPKRVANYIGLSQDGPTINATTAGGIIQIQKTLIDELIIGNIALQNVSASINPRDKTDQILLGMSALKRLEFTHMDGKLILRQKPV